MKTYEADLCVIGGGISAAMLALKLSEIRPGLTIRIVEAGQTFFDFEKRAEHRKRKIEYDENPWTGDAIADQSAKGIISRTMALGGSALHWGGACNRFSQEDLRLRSAYGLAEDWPIEWDELERYYCEAERKLGVAGEPGPFPEDRRSEPYPMAPSPLTYNLLRLKEAAENSGIPFWNTPVAKNTVPYNGRAACIRCNTCAICPTGARYSPDFTFQALLAKKAIEIHPHTQVRKLAMAGQDTRITSAQAVDRAGGEAIEFRAPVFVLASGYTWTPHLLLLSANARFPKGLANSSDHVGRYMTGHDWVTAQMEVPFEIYPGMFDTHALLSRQYFRSQPGDPYVRHDLRIWESAVGREPRLKNAAGQMLFGDDLLADWRARTTAKGTARLRAYFDTHPDRDSRLTLDSAARNQFGDPLPKIEHRLDAAAMARLDATRQRIVGIFEQLARASGGKLLRPSNSQYQDHPAGGCRMGKDPKTSVTDSYGRTHDHENLFAVGAPTLPTGGCTNGTLTFVALTLRSATEIAKAFPKKG